MKQVALLCLVLALAAGVSGCGFLDTVKAKDLLNRAAQAYNQGDYDSALTFLEEAIQLDPTLPQLKPYYGATLYAKFNLSGEEDYVRKALDIYQEIYSEEMAKPSPDEKTLNNAVAYIAVIYDNLGDKQKKLEWMQRRLEIPGMTPMAKAEVYYSLGTSYWQDSFEISQKYVIVKYPEPEYNVPESEVPKVRELANKGLEYVEQALALEPEYGDALTYKNLLLREIAKVEKDPDVRKELLAKADESRNKAMEIMKRREAEAQQQQQQAQPQP